MSEWQPISTAPKDGSEIIAFWGHATKPAYAVAWFEYDCWHEWDRDVELSEPTHWMPLPSPPATP